MAKVTLSWTQPDSSAGGIATGYLVYRKQGTENTSNIVSTSSLTSWTRLSASPQSGTTYEDNALSSGDNTFSYTVTAENAGGVSAGCNPVNVPNLSNS